ncbi:LysR family pca operon transcriptional activator [Neorhizobium galegae]|uniref:LysR family transcriptional regulator n=1 Tax=Neorhizobium galegae TaxID=399 RepID=UPI001AE2B307|nr:LysR family transcriptional regulator [Neorhizobium galegae]MBP2563261.1 LysR family pca operon transcriptional activator [Neorhizobium galegae]
MTALNPRHLKYLQVVAKAGSLLAAAKALNIAQPSLSVSISRMEDIVGQKLMDRGRHGASLTKAGQILVRHAESVDNALENALAELRLFSLGVSGPMVIGGTPLATASIIPEILSKLVPDFTPIRCDVVEAYDEDLIKGLLNNEIDVVISSMRAEVLESNGTGLIASEPIFSAQTSAVVRRGHPFALEKTLSLRDLQHALWVLPPRGSIIRTLIDSGFMVTGLPVPQNLIEAAPFGVLKEIVKQTDGVTILSDHIVRAELAEGSLVTVALAERMTPRVFGIHRLKSRDPSPVAKRFIEIAKQIGAELK